MTEALFDASTLWELVARRADATPDRAMLITDAATLTFGEFRDRAERVAAGLASLGVTAGTRVSWQLPTSIDTVVASAALCRLGAVQNPVLHLYRERELGFAVGQTQAELVVTAGTWKDFDFTAMAEAVVADLPISPRIVPLADLAEGDPATLPPAPSDGDAVRWTYYTSGTTSEPKGVLHSDASLIAGGLGLARALDMSAEDVGSIAFPFAHIAGPDYLVMVLAYGFPAILLEAFVPADAVATYARHGATMAGGSTAFYQAFLNEQRKAPDTPIIPTLRILSGGGAPKPPEVYYEAKRELGVPIAHGYGMTEVPMIAMGAPTDTDDQLANTEGKPVHGADVRIVTADGRVAGPGEDGEVRLKGPMVFRGYTDPALTEAAFDENGYFRTGDLGHLREDGHLVLTGRLKDVIIRKGENISAKEIEDLLYQHPKVGDVAVIGLPDRERGELVCAVVERGESGDDLSFDEMVAYLREAKLMTQKIPERLEIVDGLPRGGTLNKVLKNVLRDTYT